MLTRRYWTIGSMIGALCALPACGVDSQGDPSGGVDLDDGPEVRGFAVVGSDFASTTISLLGLDGQVQSSSFISSASTAPGLSAALGGDVALASSTQSGPELVVLDRLPGSVLTWVNLSTAEVRAQLSVATGFPSNPHDYVAFSSTKAFVPRHEPNPLSGMEAFDAGNDILVINPASATIEDRIDLLPAFTDAPPNFYPRADRVLLAGGQLRVLALGQNADFTDSVDSRLISIDPATNQIEDVLVFEGMKGCGNAQLSPDGAQLAVACGGTFGADPATGFGDSGVLLVDISAEPVESQRWTSAALAVGQANRVAWLDDTHLALLSFGRFNADFTVAEANDEGRSLSIGDGSISEPWLSAGPFSLGDVACSLADGVCLVADAETEGGVVHTLAVGPAGQVSVTGSVKPDPRVGLPPRSLGTF